MLLWNPLPSMTNLLGCYVANFSTLPTQWSPVWSSLKAWKILGFLWKIVALSSPSLNMKHLFKLFWLVSIIQPFVKECGKFRTPSVMGPSKVQCEPVSKLGRRERQLPSEGLCDVPWKQFMLINKAHFSNLSLFVAIMVYRDGCGWLLWLFTTSMICIPYLFHIY